MNPAEDIGLVLMRALPCDFSMVDAVVDPTQMLLRIRTHCGRELQRDSTFQDT